MAGTNLPTHFTARRIAKVDLTAVAALKRILVVRIAKLETDRAVQAPKDSSEIG
jgi:hypothetical protein